MPTYKITQTIKQQDKETSVVRVVEAPGQAKAISHVVADTITCEVLGIQEAMDLAAQGIKLEKAA